jgi:tetratricopeptide (TPR) repeat protein
MKKARARAEKARSRAAVSPPALKPWHYWLALVTALVALLTVYGPALRGPFVFDDLYLPFTGQEFANAPLARWVGGLRPLLMFSYWINYRISGMETFSYHLLNLLLHLITGSLCFLIVRKFLDRAGESGWKRDGLAAFAAGLFLLHPLQTETIAYVASRSDALSVMFLYAAFAVFLYRRSEAISWLEALAVVALFGAAANTKEHAAVFPALLLLTDYYWNPGFSFRGIRRNWRLYVLIAAAAGAALRMVWHVLRSADTAGFSVKAFTWYQYFFTQCRVIWHYLRLFLLPYGQNADPDFSVSRTLVAHGAVAALAALILAVAAAVYYRRRFPLASYGFLAFLLLLAPTSSFVPIADVVAERRMYLPFIGLLLVLVGFLRRWEAKPGRVAAVLAGVLLVMAAFTYRRSAVWGDPMALWTDAASKSPHKARPQIQLGFLYFTQGRCADALPHFEAAARFEPPQYGLLVDWGLDYECLGRHDDALAKLRQAAALRPGADTYTSIGWTYLRAGRYAEARQALDVAQRIDPNYDAAYAYRGDLYLAGNDPAAAEKEYRHALSLNPANEVAQEGLARIRGATPR